MGEKFHDPEVREDMCACEAHDYEWYVAFDLFAICGFSWSVLVITTSYEAMVNACLRVPSAYLAPSVPLGELERRTWDHLDIVRSLGISVRAVFAWTSLCPRTVPKVSAFKSSGWFCI
jgi:hypothetical protein